LLGFVISAKVQLSLFFSKNSKTGAIMKLQVVVHPAKEGGFWAEIPAFTGCVSEGETVEETLSNIKEAAEGWLEVASMRPQLL
jgi:predicted RNase H-like HicB family nuclease